MNTKKEEYNAEPVYYCKFCLSLKVIDEGDFCRCGNCGSTDILQTSIEDWEAKYTNEYEREYIPHKQIKLNTKRLIYLLPKGKTEI